MADGKGERNILVVEDDPEMRKLIRRRLERIGNLAIIDATGGQEALALLQASRFDLVLCDWNMPGVTGLDVLKQTRATPNLRQIPFVMVTGESDRAKVLEAAQSGVTDYIIKPFTAEVLEAKVKSFLG